MYKNDLDPIEMIQVLRKGFPAESIGMISVYLVFLKYLFDNEKMPLNENSYRALFGLQRMFDLKELNETALRDVSLILEDTCEFPENSLTNLAEVFIKFSTSYKSERYANEIFNVYFSSNYKNKGKELLSILKEVINNVTTSYNRLTGDLLTNESESELIKELLNVQDGDSFCDIAYGYGLSTLKIVGEKDCRITGFEIDRSLAATAGMLLILSGNEDDIIHEGNHFVTDVGTNAFDKMAVMPALKPEAYNISPEKEELLKDFHLSAKKQTINGDIIIVLSILNALKDGGRAVVSVTPNLLYAANIMEKTFREELVKRNYLKAVIQLPGLHYTSNINTILLVLEKNGEESGTEFIDASGNGYFEFSKLDSHKTTIMLPEGIEKIVSDFEEHRTEEGISTYASKEDIEAKGYLLMPSRYITIPKEYDLLPNEEIDGKLQRLYEQAKMLMDEFDQVSDV